ncbi:hypothetical protein QW71_23025 [Paenibacillus sp. IHB B 3415]|nr:hypothetical protein QW71_23025 [Paenibacillus sp. IHB B 3415]
MWGGGGALVCVYIPLNPPFQGGPQGLAALWTPAGKCSEWRVTMAEGEGLEGAALLRLPWRVCLRSLSYTAGRSPASAAIRVRGPVA